MNLDDLRGPAPYTPPGEWVENATCRATHPDLMYPSDRDPAAIDLALAYCNACPVRETCLTYTLDHERGTPPNNRHGIAGGLTPHERFLEYRRRYKRARKAQLKAARLKAAS